jgi:hypothetical protein
VGAAPGRRRAFTHTLWRLKMARKIRMDVEKLTVESFEAGEEKQTERGTVHGVMSQLGCDTMYDGTCNNYGTCHYWGVCSPIP